MTDKRQYVGPISGFPEWLPEERAVEQEWMDAFREISEAHGYTSIETRIVEPLPILMGEGDNKEIYEVTRVGSETDEKNLGLHFDQTVPFARYVVQHLNDLTLPFKRYQTQKVYRGEKSQGGRYREFRQCDIDVLARNKVPLYFDSEVSHIALTVLHKLNIGKLTFRMNNRKLLEGFYKGNGIQETAKVINIMDKIDKIGADGVTSMLKDDVGLKDSAIAKCLTLGKISGLDPDKVAQEIMALGVKHPDLEEGLDELLFLRRSLNDLPKEITPVMDLSITRGLAYYTGNVFETELENGAFKTSVCSGGSYANLAGSMSKEVLPGVGISIGLTRLMANVKAAGLLPKRAQTPANIMMAYMPNMNQSVQMAKAQLLRREGYNVDVYPEPAKMKKQMKYAHNKGIPYVYFIGTDGTDDEVRNMEKGVQGAPHKILRNPTTRKLTLG